MLTAPRVSPLASSRLALLALVIVTVPWKSLTGLSRVTSLAAPALSVAVPVTSSDPPVSVIVPVAETPLTWVSTFSVPPMTAAPVKSTAPEVSRSRLAAVLTAPRVSPLASSRLALLAAVIVTVSWKSLAALSRVMSLAAPELSVVVPVTVSDPPVSVIVPVAETPLAWVSTLRVPPTTAALVKSTAPEASRSRLVAVVTEPRVSALASSRLALLALVIVTAPWKSLAALSRVMSLAAPALSVVVPVTLSEPAPVSVIVPVAEAPLA